MGQSPESSPTHKAWSELLLVEYEHLEAGLRSYSNSLTKAISGLAASGVALLWYSLQRPEYTDLLCFVSSFGLHVWIAYVIYLYLVHRTLKATKAIQSERLNSVYAEGQEPLIWERIWHAIWAGTPALSHSGLAALVFALYCIVLSIVLYICANHGARFLEANDSAGLIPAYYALMVILAAVQISVPLWCRSRVSRAVTKVAANHCRS